MRDEIRRAFDSLTEAPHPALRSALRAQLEAGSGDEPPRFWRVTVAATLVAGIVGLAFVVSLSLSPRGGTVAAPVARTTATPTAEPTPTPSPSPSPTVSAGPSAAPPVVPSSACPAVSGGSAAAMSNVVDVRVGTFAAYDRIVIQFDGAVPAYNVTPQGSADFMQDANGQTLHLQGTNGVRIVVHGASGTDLNGKQTFKGSQDLKPGYAVLQEARQVGDFERVFSWGLGLSQPDCVRVTTLSAPNRLVVDVLKP